MYCKRESNNKIIKTLLPVVSQLVLPCVISPRLKVIPQKQKLPIHFFETFPECSLPSTVSKNAIKVIGHHSCLRDMTGQSYLICACTRVNHVRCSSVHVTFFDSSKHSF